MKVVLQVSSSLTHTRWYPYMKSNFGERFGALQLVQQVINPGKRVTILDSSLFKSFVINNNSPSSILLGYYDDG